MLSSTGLWEVAGSEREVCEPALIGVPFTVTWRMHRVSGIHVGRLRVFGRGRSGSSVLPG
jgi:hypothetical protein